MLNHLNKCTAAKQTGEETDKAMHKSSRGEVCRFHSSQGGNGDGSTPIRYDMVSTLNSYADASRTSATRKRFCGHSFAFV